MLMIISFLTIAYVALVIIFYLKPKKENPFDGFP
jgi:hypothetical protein